jgi:hypothetical protein
VYSDIGNEVYPHNGRAVYPDMLTCGEPGFWDVWFTLILGRMEYSDIETTGVPLY